MPRENSNGGKDRLGGITKAGHQYLRGMLIVGATAVVLCRTAGHQATVACVAVRQARDQDICGCAANKNARVASSPWSSSPHARVAAGFWICCLASDETHRDMIGGAFRCGGSQER